MSDRLKEILARTQDFEKPVELKPVRRPLQEVPTYDIHKVMPFVMDAIDTPDNYDIWVGDKLLTDLTPMQTVLILRRILSQLMREVNDVQQELTRIETLEMSVDDPRGDDHWQPDRWWVIQPKEEIKR